MGLRCFRRRSVYHTRKLQCAGQSWMKGRKKLSKTSTHIQMPQPLPVRGHGHACYIPSMPYGKSCRRDLVSFYLSLAKCPTIHIIPIFKRIFLTQVCKMFLLLINTLRPRQMDAISQTTFSNAFSWMKMHEFRLRFHWSLFLRFELTIFQHWFR